MTHPLPGENAPQLEGLDKTRWDVAAAEVAALSQPIRDGSLDAETLTGGLAALTQVPLDMGKILNSVHVPKDAGEYSERLERMLRRIPDGWGRWVRCDAGWYELLVNLDEQIAALLPDYEIHQMKEKYGTLRFYWELPEPTPECCQERKLVDPRPLAEPIPSHLAPAGRAPEMQELMDDWLEREQAHVASEEHATCEASLLNGPEAARRAAAAARVNELIREAERRSATICERCAASGTLRSQGYWLKTLCGPCAEHLDFTDEA